MKHLLISHLTIAAFVAALAASWKGLVAFYVDDPAAIVCIVAIYGGFSVWFAAIHAGAALREAREAATLAAGSPAGACKAARAYHATQPALPPYVATTD